jgi:cytochrome b pre-mRNA-processing protein 3
MITRLFRRNPNRDTIDALYGAIVAQARTPAFYLEGGVPDTVSGRFDLMIVHVFLVARRLMAEGGEGPPAMAQDLVDRFFADMDASLRELGVGDLSVPKKIKGMAEAYKGRASAYAAALEAQDDRALSEALGRNLYPDDLTPPAGAPAMLAAYMRRGALALAGQDWAELARGRVVFPPVAEGRS